jgi:hypothetical protein
MMIGIGIPISHKRIPRMVRFPLIFVRVKNVRSEREFRFGNRNGPSCD